MSNSVISRQGSLMGATMSNKAVCFPVSRSITERDLIGARASCGVPVQRSHHCEPAVSNYSTMSNSVISRQGSLMGATMSNKAVCFPVSRSITDRDLIGARASCGVPVQRSFVNGYNPWIGSSFGPSFRSNIPPLPSMEWNYTGATMSNKAVCFPSSYLGSSYVERDLLGAEMSCHAPLPYSSMYFGVHNYINAYPLPAVASGLLGAEMSNHTAHPNYSTYVGVQPINAHPVPTVGWASRVRNELSERDLLEAQMSNHTAHPNYATYVGVQPINTHPVPMEGWASRVRNELSERDRLGAEMSDHTAHPNYPTYVGVQPINAHPVPMEGWASRVRNQLGSS